MCKIKDTPPSIDFKFQLFENILVSPVYILVVSSLAHVLVRASFFKRLVLLNVCVCGELTKFKKNNNFTSRYLIAQRNSLFVSNTLPLSHNTSRNIYNMAGKLPGGFSGSQSGRGLRDTPQGEIEIACRYNAQLAENLNKMGLDARTVYPSGAAEALDLLTTEICYVPKKDQNSNSRSTINRHMPAVLSALNGLGATAAELFPGDEQMQVEEVLNGLRILGTAFANVKYEPGQTRSGDVAIQIKGVHSRIAKTDIFPGTYGEYYASTPAQLRSGDRVLEPHVHPSKVTIEIRPFDHKIAAERVLLHVRRCLYDNERYKQAMNPQYRSTNAWINTADNFFIFSLMSGILFLNQFGPSVISTYSNVANDTAYKAGFNQAIATNDGLCTTAGVPNQLPIGSPIPDTPDLGAFDRAEFEKRLLILAYRIGLLDESISIGSVVNNATRDAQQFNIVNQEVLKDMKRRYLGSVFFDGKIADLAFGFNERGGPANPGVDEQTGKLQVSNPYGNFIHKQLNVPTMFVSSLTDAFRRQQERIAGKVTRGAVAGQMFSWID